MKSFKKKYEEHLQSDKWKEIRKAKAEEQHYTCERCGKVVLSGFHIHHKTYAHLGNEPLTDLMFLCEDCHIEVHIGLRAEKNNKKKKPAEQKSCSTCLFSQIMKYKGKTARTVLYCNLNLCECENVCKRYRKGAVKTLPKSTQKKKKSKKKTKKPVKRSK